MARLWSLAAALLLLVDIGGAQSSGWATNQVNTTMCAWKEPRAAIIRDTLYIDGGYLYWKPGLSDGTFGAVVQDNNPYGLVYLLNFSTPFDTAQNFTPVLKTISKAPAGGLANNIGPNYYDGAMFANDGEWYTYGGLLTISNGPPPPSATSVKEYEAYWYGAADKLFAPSFIDAVLPDGITRYVSDGAGVSVPSENMGFYFSGLRSASSGPIYFPQGDDSLNANVISNTLISLDMSIQRSEKWTNQTLPSSVPGRANAELVWVPVSTKGVLIAIGGVVDPVYATKYQSLTPAQLAESAAVSPGFMTTVSVYDIASSTWYQQATTGTAPGALTQGCAVLASAPDYSSHNIYFYGGFDGLNTTTHPFSDDMWVLSVPSFIWTKAKAGDSASGRAGHKCFKPYPDQMFVIGGYAQLIGTNTFPCLKDGIVRSFNLSSLEWLPTYNPTQWSNYSVPSVITSVVGGSGSGGATTLSPQTWASQSLAALFSSKYDRTKIKSWYPYTPTPVTNNTRPPLIPDTPTSSGTPPWLAPVLGSVLGLIALSSVVLGIFLYRRRAYFKKHGSYRSSDVATSDLNRYRVLNWVRGGQEPKSPGTVTSSDDAMNATDVNDINDVASEANVAEAAGDAVFEMADTSKVQELSGTGTGMAYLYTHDGQGRINSTAKSGVQSSTSATSRISELSSSTQSSIYSASTAAYRRPESPLTGSARPGHSRMVSEVSAESAESRPETPGQQQRAAGQEAPRLSPEPGRVKSPVSPPTPQGTSDDYLSAGSSTYDSTSTDAGTQAPSAGQDVMREMRRDLSTATSGSGRPRRKSAFGEML